MALIVEKELFDHAILVTKTNHEIIDAVVNISLHDVPQRGFPPISTIGFGFESDSSAIRVPRPPARITAFI
jgi:hypothetical protein